MYIQPRGFGAVFAAVALAFVALAGAALWYLHVPNPAGGMPQEPVACTMEAKLCPDGSYVGRSGPHCEFDACPEATTTSPQGGAGEGIAPYHSGIHGTVLLGPTCPVMQNPPQEGCADKPYASTLVAVYRAGNPAHAFVLLRTNEAGYFEVSLPPGDYTVGASEDNHPQCAIVLVTVQPDAYATTTISCDTGIR